MFVINLSSFVLYLSLVVCGGGWRWWMVVDGGGWPLETKGYHRGQFPRTDFGPVSGIKSSYNAARIPKAFLLMEKQILSIKNTL